MFMTPMPKDEREWALRVYAEIIRRDPGFFDDYPRDYEGPMSDDEKAEIISNAVDLYAQQDAIAARKSQVQ